VAVLRDGLLQQVAAPNELYHQPANRFVADFVGQDELLDATRGSGWTGDVAVYRLATGDTVHGPPGPERAVLAVRPEAIRVGHAAARRRERPDRGARLPRLPRRADRAGVRLADGTRVVARASELDHGLPGAGDTLPLWWPVDRTTVLPADA
jgi:ABC-type Fe3+/spermidine/putrescine transport system ATPase subunit